MGRRPGQDGRKSSNEKVSILKVLHLVHDQRLDAEHGLLQLAHHPLHPGLKVRLVWRETHPCVVQNHLE